MSRQEFQSRVRASRRVLLPIGILVLILVFAGPFGLFGITIPPFQAALRACLGISRDTADLVCLGLMLFSPFVLLLLVLYINRHYGLFCPRCGPRTPFFVNHVSKYWVNFTSKDQVTINGPERPKWTFQRADEGIRLDFDAPKTSA